MLYEIFAFLLGTATSILVGACLLRVYLQGMRIPFSNPLGQLVLTLTDWLVRPVRRVLQAHGRWDWVTLLIAYLLLVLQFLLLIAVTGQFQLLGLAPVRAIFALASTAIWLAIGLLLVLVVLSWLMPGHWLHTLAGHLCAPLLNPIRKALPGTGQVDFAPMVLTVLLYISLIVLRRAELSILSGMARQAVLGY